MGIVALMRAKAFTGGLCAADGASADMCSRGIECLPTDVFEDCLQITRLKLDGNRLHELPASISRLQLLRTLSLGSRLAGGNMLCDIAPVLALSALVELRVEHNMLRALPDMSAMSALRSASFAHNAIEAVGPGSHSRVSKMLPDGLETLDLSWNAVCSIASDVAWPRALRQLNLAHNKLAAVSRAAFSHLPPTCHVSLSFNPLCHASPVDIEDTVDCVGGCPANLSRRASASVANSNFLAFDGASNHTLGSPLCDCQTLQLPQSDPQCAKGRSWESLAEAASRAIVRSAMPAGRLTLLAREHVDAVRAVCGGCMALHACAAGRVCVRAAICGYPDVPVVEDVCSQRCLRRLLQRK